MAPIRPAPDGAAGAWLLRRDVGWMDLVRFGPPGFAAYVRIALSSDRDTDPVGEALAVLARHGDADGWLQEPHLVWPEDRAWCLACEVDEETEFTVGCSEEAAEAPAGALPGRVRRAGYGEETPLHR